MLEYYRIDIWEDIDTNKTSDLDEPIICHYCLLLRINFKFQSNVCDGCHRMTKDSWALAVLPLSLWKYIIVELTFGLWLKAKI